MEHSSRLNQRDLASGFLPFSSDHTRSLASESWKKSFLVYRDNKYVVVPTRKIAFFYTKFEKTVLVSFDKQEYFVNYRLEQIQHLLSSQQFYPLNQQYLVNFTAIKEVEYYFARKLLVNLVISFPEKLLVPKENAKSFLAWLANR